MNDQSGIKFLSDFYSVNFVLIGYPIKTLFYILGIGNFLL
jgi:hypothetical protein